MSRLALAFTFIASLSTGALARRVPAEPLFGAPIHFAQPPDSARSGAALPMVVVDRAAVRAKLAKNRLANVARFRVYQKKGVFPSNTYTDGKLNVWRDDFGNLCAAATIINASGQTDLVLRTAEQNNFIRLGDVTSGPLMDWILTSGLTQAEIAAIQEPFEPVMDEPGNQPLAVDPILRRNENRRLAMKYKAVEASIARDTKKSLDAATDRLMANPDLATSFLSL
jgi:hypothetical protein